MARVSKLLPFRGKEQNQGSLVFEIPEKLTNEFLDEFGRRYHHLKKKRKLPVQIKAVIKDLLKCSDSTYYRILRAAREEGFVKDSYERNVAKLYERNRQKMRKN